MLTGNVFSGPQSSFKPNNQQLIQHATNRLTTKGENTLQLQWLPATEHKAGLLTSYKHEYKNGLVTKLV